MLSEPVGVPMIPVHEYNSNEGISFISLFYAAPEFKLLLTSSARMIKSQIEHLTYASNRGELFSD
jgi:hypothetical protein